MAGLADYLETVMGSPLFLGGAALASGEGFGGAMQGMAAGNKFRAEARKRQVEQQRDAFLEGLGTNPDFKNVDPRLIQMAQASRDPSLVASSVAGERSFNLDKMRTEADIAARRQSMALTAAQLEQTKMQTPQWRMANAKTFGIDVTTPEGQAWVVNGTYAPKDPLSSVISSMLAPAIKGAPAPTPGPSAQPSPIQPQRYDGAEPATPLWNNGGEVPGADPNLVKVDNPAAPSPQPAPAAPQVSVPMFGPMSQEQAEKLAMGLALGKKDAAANMIQSAIDKDKLSKKSMGDVEEQMIARISDLSELQNIKTKFEQNPQLLEAWSKAKAMGISWQAWFNSSSVSEQDRAFLKEHTKLTTATVERLNNRIKAMSGSAVSGQEADRMTKANPTDRDDPITFSAKLDEQMDMQRMAIARYNWLKTQGLRPDQIKELATSGKIAGYAALDDMKGIYNKRAQEIDQQLRARQPNLQPQQYREIRNRQLKQEFGI